MIVNGRDIAASIRESLKKEITALGRPIRLAFFVTTTDFATQKFIEIKRAVGVELGVRITQEILPEGATTEELEKKIRAAAQSSDGIIVQFPLAEGLDSERIRNAVPMTHDIDVISDSALLAFQKGKLGILPPVVGALKEILDRAEVSLPGKRVVVVGKGRLVGRPVAVWCEQKGAQVTVADKATENLSTLTRAADVLILGAGVPGLITPDMIKDKAVLLDAGTSEASGKLAGDADPACASKCMLFTPVPGGVGPITVAMIFKNLFTLAAHKNA